MTEGEVAEKGFERKPMLNPMQATEELEKTAVAFQRSFRKEGVKEKGVLRNRTCANPPPKRKDDAAMNNAIDEWFKENFD